MKLNKYFMIGAMGLSLVACSDNLDDNQGVNGNASNEGSTYAALKIDFGSSSASRATGDGPVGAYDDAEEGNEKDINDVRIIVTNEAGAVEYNGVATKTTVGQQDYYMIKIQPGVKTFYAIVNGEALKLTAPTTWGAQTVAKVKASDLYDYNGTAKQGDGFAMASVAGVEQRIVDDITEEEAQAGPTNKVNLTVERMVAKATVKLADALVGTDGFDQENFALQTLSAQIMNADNVDLSGTEPAYAGTYWMAYDDNGVRKTPYYTYPTNGAASIVNIDETKLASGEAQTLYAPNEATKNPSGRFYCLENTHAAGTYYMGNTTYLKLTATMIPNNLVTFGKTDNNITVSNKTEDVTTASTFYTITGGYDTDDKEKVYCVLASDLAYAYTAIVGGAESDEDAKVTAVLEALKDAGYKLTQAYTNGQGIYRIPLNDLKEGANYVNIQPVFRNDWYDLSITGVELPGDPAGEGFDPEEPFHQTTNVAMVVTVRQWNKVVYDDVELK